MILFFICFERLAIYTLNKTHYYIFEMRRFCFLKFWWKAGILISDPHLTILVFSWNLFGICLAKPIFIKKLKQAK
jgi:hypothetical protein